MCNVVVLSPFNECVCVRAATVSTLAGSTVGNVNSVNGTGAKFNKPKGLALSSDASRVYVADSGNSAIRAVNTANGNTALSLCVGVMSN